METLNHPVHSVMNTPTPSSLPSRPASGGSTGARPLVVAVLAYVSAVSASVGAVAAVVGAGLPLDLLVAVA
jgi:hypothetical protein